MVSLPRDSTPIDFAYTVHTEVGHACVGARVNGRMVPIRHKLRRGDIVEIVTQTGHKPSRDWLSLVKSSRARAENPPLAEYSPARTRHRNRPQADRERSAQIPRHA